MAGHSKWKNNLHRKTAQDAKRSANFGKLSKAITVAVIEGGSPDPAFNARLRVAIENARSGSMPKDNIERAIAKGTGAGKDSLKSMIYEIFAPGGVQMIVTATTDNPNRTNGEMHSLVHTHGAKLGNAGTVLHAFQHCATMEVTVDAPEAVEPLALTLAETLCAYDVDIADQCIRLYFPFAEMNKAEEIATQRGAHITEQPQAIYLPHNMVNVSEDVAQNLDILIEALKDHDDIQDVFHNATVAMPS